MGLTEARDLRGGSPSWEDNRWPSPPSDPIPATECDIAIIGGGIMGAILAERLTAEGHGIVVLDRRVPGTGSTAASTAEVMWAMDVPLCRLAADIGEAEAARRWQCVYRAVHDLGRRIDQLAIDCERADRPTLYLAGRELGAEELGKEAELHDRHHLPSQFLDAGAVSARFGIPPKAAILSGGGYAIDPVKLVQGLLEAARRGGARICFPRDVMSLRSENGGVVLAFEDGVELAARYAILASGYERATLFLPPEFRLLSTFVMATSPDTAPLWRENAMIWEASNPYLYIRTDQEGRVIAGGEDEDFSDPLQRDPLIGTKAGSIAAKTGALLGCDPLVAERTWAATFGSSPDGLPAIGRAANTDNIWLAAGFGGNGIAFAGLAAEILAAELAGSHHPDAACFDPYRFRRE